MFVPSKKVISDQKDDVRTTSKILYYNHCTNCTHQVVVRALMPKVLHNLHKNCHELLVKLAPNVRLNLVNTVPSTKEFRNQSQ